MPTTQKSFKQSVKSLAYLPSDLREEFVSLADSMAEQEIALILPHLQDLNRQLEKNEQKQSTVIQRMLIGITQIKDVDIPRFLSLKKQ